MFLCDFVEVGGLIMLFSIYDEINNELFLLFLNFFIPLWSEIFAIIPT